MELTDQQLSTLSQQLMSFELKLRKRGSELAKKLAQKEALIREQACVIQYLLQKLGHPSCRNINKLRHEALSKIPHLGSDAPKLCVASKNVTTIQVNGKSETDDSDSAIIVVDPIKKSLPSPHSVKLRRKSNLNRFSKSVSDISATPCPKNLTDGLASASSGNLGSNLDWRRSAKKLDKIMKPEEIQSPELSRKSLELFSSSSGCSSQSSHDFDDDDELLEEFDRNPSSEYRGFLMRHGSFERFKSRANKIAFKQDSGGVDTSSSDRSRNQINRTNMKNGFHVHEKCQEKTLIPDLYVKQSIKPKNGIKHRNIVKPRDVKNRSSRTRSTRFMSNIENLQNFASQR